MFLRRGSIQSYNLKVKGWIFFLWSGENGAGRGNRRHQWEITDKVIIFVEGLSLLTSDRRRSYLATCSRLIKNQLCFLNTVEDALILWFIVLIWYVPPSSLAISWHINYLTGKNKGNLKFPWYTDLKLG